MHEWQCESEWGWGIYVFSPWQTFTVPSFCAAFALWRAFGSFREKGGAEILAQNLHKTRPDILFAQFLHKQAACTEFALKYLPKIAQKCTNYLAIISFYLLLYGQ
jgi:hypothetical protein